MDINTWAAATPYLAQLAPQYWSWDDDASAISWNGGPTITFRQDLVSVLARHAERGLPPFVPTLLVLAARRSSWPESGSRLVSIISERSSIDRHMPDWVDDVLTALEMVHLVPRTADIDSQLNADLIEYLFDQPGLERCPTEASRAVVELLAGDVPREWVRVGSKGTFDLWRDLGVLRDCLKHFRSASFEQWRQTSVPSALESPESPLPPHEQVRSLLTQLSSDEELGGVARLARQMLALVTLPQPVSHPDSMPLGGYTDIANRGSLDRLLVSELVHEDLTLAVRIANNEALYVRRETPPSPPPAERLVLLDSGVRMWGKPRVFATAVGLALAAGKNKNITTHLFRASGTGLVPVDCLTRTGIQGHLQALELGATPGPALTALAHEQKQTKLAEAVLVTSEEALKDTGFLKAWWNTSLGNAWLITVARSGRLRLFRGGVAGFVAVREAKLDLEAILHPTAARQVDQPGPTLPAYCRLDAPPLRISQDPRAGYEWVAPEIGLMAITKDERLIMWDSPRHGARELKSGLPLGRLLWAGPSFAYGMHTAIIGALSSRSMYRLLIEVSTPDVRIEPFGKELSNYLHQDQILDVFGTRQHIFVIAVKSCAMWSRVGRGVEFLGCIDIPRFAQWIGRQFFWDTARQQLAIFGYFGSKLAFAPQDSYRTSTKPLYVAEVGDVPTRKTLISSGQIVIEEPGTPPRVETLRGDDGDRLRRALAAPGVLKVSRDGLRIVCAPATTKALGIDLTAETYQNVEGVRARDFLEPERSKYLSLYPTPRRKFRSIAKTERGLLLLTPKDHILQIENLPLGPVLREVSNSTRQAYVFRNFTAVHGHANLQKVAWPDGSEIWLDCRGLLHLRSSDREIPELTLVLHVGQMAGWCASGSVFGNPYFLGPNKTTSNEGHHILDRFVRRLP